MQSIKNIIFDFGGVVLNINYQLSVNAFKEIGLDNFENIYAKAAQINIFDDLEKGLISPKDFRYGIRNISGINLSDELIDNAWNKIILDLPIERAILLKNLKKKYRTFLLSNTNKIHYDLYLQNFQKLGFNSFDDIFEKAYFSHEMGMRKPNHEIFEFVLQEQQLIPGETLFIDDSIQHIEAAKKLGIKPHHLTQNEDIIDLFDKNLNLII